MLQLLPAPQPVGRDIAPGMRASEAFARIAVGAASGLRGAFDAALIGEVEGVHELRVGVRRLRAVLGLFKPHLSPAAILYGKRLRDAGRAFGAARDWDVLVTEALPEARKAGVPAAVIEALEHAAGEARRDAHARLRAFLEGPEFGPALSGLAAWAADGADDPALLGDPAILSQPVGEVAPDLLARSARRLARRARGHRHADAAALHRLRKAAKSHRYAVEALIPLYAAGTVATTLRRCKHLQSVLGRVNDAAAIPALVQPLDAEAWALCDWAAARGAKARKKVTKAWHALRDTAPFWE